MPQFIVIALYATALGISLANNGKENVKKENFWISLLSSSIMMTLLWWGGFFS